MMRQTLTTLSPTANTNYAANEDVSAPRLANAASKKVKTTAAPAPQVTPDDSVNPAPLHVPGALITGAEMWAVIRDTYRFKTLADIDKCVGSSSVQLPMLLDQLPVPFSAMSETAKKTLRFHDEGVTSAVTKVRLSALDCIKGFLPHTIVKSPTDKKTADYKAWQSYTPPKNQGRSFNRNVYAFVGQFPMALSAESIFHIFHKATGIMPLCVDHLPKGAKVFLLTPEDVEKATRWNQTMQVTEYGTLFTALPETSVEEIAASREKLMLVRREVDCYFQCCASAHDPYGTVLAHSKEQAAKMADAKSKKAAEKATKAGDAAPTSGVSGAPSIARFGKDSRNGTYPMTIEAPKEKK